ncbi:hypothetical protein F511_13826 [Dorcoceras hygrometricum]|uniref:CCHC-type domain-containing protein n=1 Tax=Dorcoceras hygrometricum TaxID=472368 RepID=A0A2Z7BZN5_9LAMI|nr:hypothetical protein F511_13826 [Dorcoceras hygrometricum]
MLLYKCNAWWLLQFWEFSCFRDFVVKAGFCGESWSVINPAVACFSARILDAVVLGGRPIGQGAQSSQSSQSAHYPQQQQQVAQQSGGQRFRSHGQQFKKKSGSGSFGSGSSSSSGSQTEFCGFCGGKHPSTQCVGVQGSYNLCGQYGHFARVCSSAGSQQAAAQPQGHGGQSRGRSQQFQQPRMGKICAAADFSRCLPAFYEIVTTQILLAEPLGSLAFKMVQVRQLMEEQQV